MQIIFVTDEDHDTQSLAKKLDGMAYRIYFASYSSRPSNVIAIWRSVSLECPFLPTAIIIDYFCAGGRCKEMLRAIRRMVQNTGVEFVIHNVPAGDSATRRDLLAWGADTIIDADAFCGKPAFAH